MGDGIGNEMRERERTKRREKDGVGKEVLKKGGGRKGGLPACMC